MDFCNLTPGETLKHFNTSRDGLTDSQIAALQKRGKKNVLPRPPKKNFARLILAQLANVMTVILLAAALVAGFFSQWMDLSIIFFVVALNAVLGAAQEKKAEKAIEALSKLTEDTALVRRGGKLARIPAAGLFEGDIVIIEAGDGVPADLRLTDCRGLAGEEAPLTGESVPSHKTADALPGRNAPIGDRKNMLFMGCTVAAGRGEGVVTAIGGDTEVGKIARLLNDAEKAKTPLQTQLDKVGRIISVSVVVICALVFALNIVRFGAEKDNLVNYLLLSVSLAVAAIPEGLNTVITLVMAVGVTRMSKKNAIVRRLPAVETLGCTEVICSDKTGTLTLNKMTVVSEFCPSDAARPTLLTAAALCNNSFVLNGKFAGDPTETALADYCASRGYDKTALDRRHTRAGEIAFDSGRKRMSTVHADGGGFTAYCKGAPDVLIGLCSHVVRGGERVPLDGAARAQILERNGAEAKKGRRVLGFAYKALGGNRRPLTPDSQPSDFKPLNPQPQNSQHLNSHPLNPHPINSQPQNSLPADAEIETGLTFLGLIAMADPARPEAAAAVAQCKKAGIRPVMITGDHADTAVAVGRELGIISSEREAMTGAELDKLTDAQFAEAIGRYGVYARVSPENKVRIVKAWRARGKVCAMTGDGVNDAPALKNADIGVGMGLSGTDAAKQAADIVLADDNFATIVLAVEEGRKIYDNIRKTIQFLLSTNLSEVLTLLLSGIFGLNLINAVQILWVNLVTDTVPAVGLGLERGESDIMNMPPRRKSSGIFSAGVGFHILWQSMAMTFFVLAAYLAGCRASAETGRTMAFITLSLSQIAHSLNLKKRNVGVFSKGAFDNPTLAAGAAFVLLLSIFILYTPGVNAAFGIVPLSALNLLCALGLSFSIIPVVEFVKLFGRSGNLRPRKRLMTVDGEWGRGKGIGNSG
ncbi:MAG: cation-translocating P-type ATPase [Clostridiales bacterium]|jgi:Ca2+-transporting ATPase|nr:cation-translocating P-type ATPase [Clostridiales bacterium]